MRETLHKLRAAFSRDRSLWPIHAKYWNQLDRWDRPDGELLAGEQHLVFRATVPTRIPFVEVPFRAIQKLTSARVWGFVPAVRIETSEETYLFTLLRRAGPVVEAIRRRQYSTPQD